ncbi:MAG TPA: hypothetical protein VNZ06_15020 [Steroidobacteraceae bacterium]|jgi:hypothetical protein|nr:hypothetical protein [Steroidobacteraceae bacterium]
MALIACRECTHDISDKASRCPHCGAPASMSAARRRRLRRIAYALLAVLVVAWGGLTALWLSGRITSPSQIADLFRSHDGGVHAIGPPASAPSAAPIARTAPDSAPQSVYQTSAEQLYQDYNANAVATQSRIGSSRVRITGSVADINQDSVGHPILALWTSSDARVDMVLNDDQRAAVAQLSKGDAVDIQCDHMLRIASAPHGSDCALALIDADARQVYLAVFLSSSSGSAPAYVVGPMPQGFCLSRQDSLSAQLNANPKSDHIASRDCTATARERIALDGCHLSTTMSAIPEVPGAHLWKYDCGATTVLTARKSKESEQASPRRKSSDAAESELAADAEQDFTAKDAPKSASSVPPVAPVVAESSPSPSTPPQTTVPPNAAAASTATATSPSPTTPAATSTAATPAPVASAAQPDDLGSVRATDPGAADHIVSYCNAATASATDRASVSAGCRHAEAGAWTRLVLNNEFPTMDDAIRRKCNEPPFPDSYVAKESCAKYQLHVN